MKKILFICLGNICRSPSAEGIFQSLIDSHKSGSKIACDSAGIIGYHAGNGADSRMQKHAKKRGYILTSISRQIDPDSDFDTFDYVIGMDLENMNNLKSLARTDSDKSKIHLMTDFCTTCSDPVVPDPYYGGDAGFEQVLDILEDACEGLYQEISLEI
jgi:protein-tyrosine phosphatase